MRLIYISVGSKSEADGLTVQQAYVDDDGNYIGGQENMVSLQAREEGRQLSAEEYAAGFYKGKLISKEQFDEVEKDKLSNRGYAGGIVDENGLTDMDDRRKQQKQVTNDYFAKRDEGLINEAEAIQQMVPDISIKDLLVNRRIPPLVADRIIEKRANK